MAADTAVEPKNSAKKAPRIDFIDISPAERYPQVEAALSDESQPHQSFSQMETTDACLRDTWFTGTSICGQSFETRLRSTSPAIVAPCRAINPTFPLPWLEIALGAYCRHLAGSVGLANPLAPFQVPLCGTKPQLACPAPTTALDRHVYGGRRSAQRRVCFSFEILESFWAAFKDADRITGAHWDRTNTSSKGTRPMANISTNLPKVISIRPLRSTLAKLWASIRPVPNVRSVEEVLSANERRAAARADVDRLLHRAH